MKLNLSEYGISSLINDIEHLGDTLTDTGKSIVDKLVDTGIAKARELNNSAPRSGLHENTIDGEKAKLIRNKYSGSVYMTGEDAIFDEFGTGEEGASDPHPLSGTIQFSMPPYSGYITGPYVSTHVNPKNGRHYWYYSPMDGKPYFDFPDEGKGYTEGIPSGKQMYNTLQYLRQEEKGITKSVLHDALHTFKK